MAMHPEQLSIAFDCNSIFLYDSNHMILKEIEDKELAEHITALPADRREVYLLADGKLRLSGVSATTMVNNMRANHNTGIMETYVLGQGYIAGALLQSTVKGNDRVRLDIECGGPIKGMSVESWATGAVRGRLFANPIPLSKPVDSFDTSLLYGPGFLSITKILEGSRTPFTGQIMMENGNLANDLAIYFSKSEQTPTLFYLSIRFDKLGRVVGAGGLFIQALPGCPDNILGKATELSSHLSPLGQAISEGTSIRKYIESEFSSMDPVYQEGFPIGFSCPCSKRHYSSYLKALPEDEKKALLEKEDDTVIECLNCATEYTFTHEELESLFQEESR